MLREELKNLPSTRRDWRSFGLTMAAALLAAAIVLWWKERSYFLNLVYPALLFGVLAVFAPSWLRPLQRVWMALAVVIGFVMNRVILTVVYIVLFTPAAVLLRVFGKDLLHERWDKTAESYWVKRTPVPYQAQNSEKMY